MSYILDALRRADAERERGEVPSLHSQQYSGSTGDDETRARPRWLLASTIALVLAVGAALLWKFAGGSPATTPSASGVVVLPPPAASLPAVVLPTSPAASTASAPSPATPASATAVAEPVPPANLGTRRTARTTSASAPTSVAARKLAARPGASSASSPVINPASPAADRGALPDAVRRDLPALAFGGSSYSNDAASRMVIFNGRVFHEGDTIAPQLTLEQIKQKAAVLRYKGYTYEIAF